MELLNKGSMQPLQNFTPMLGAGLMSLRNMMTSKMPSSLLDLGIFHKLLSLLMSNLGGL